MASIMYDNVFTFYCISIIPLVRIRHIQTSPSGKSRFTTSKSPFNQIGTENGLSYIPLHVFYGVCMPILHSDIAVEISDSPYSLWSDDIVILHSSSHR